MKCKIPRQEWLRKRRHKKIIENLCPGERILDVGCNDCELLKKVRKRFKVNCDIKLYKKGKNFLKASAECLPFRDNSFDNVVCSEALEYMSKPELALDEMKRVLDKKGTLVLTVPNPATEGLVKKILMYLSIWRWGKNDKNIWPKRLKQLVNKANFSIEKYKLILFLFSQLIVAKKKEIVKKTGRKRRKKFMKDTLSKKISTR